jgi:hypothetical protein
MIGFIGWKLMHDKKRNLAVYGTLPLDFIGRESRGHLLNRSFSNNREGT